MHFMKTLQEDIDDLDRMVDNNAAKDAVRSQIRLLAREVAALEAAYGHLSSEHEVVVAHKAAVEEKLAHLKVEIARRDDDPGCGCVESSIPSPPYPL